jgi:hypothetical protein
MGNSAKMFTVRQEDDGFSVGMLDGEKYPGVHLSYDYMHRLREVKDAVRRFREEFDDPDDHDLALRRVRCARQM